MTSRRQLRIFLLIIMILYFRTLAKLGLPPSTASYRDYQDNERMEDDLLLSRP